jgi:hypothetical protein
MTVPVIPGAYATQVPENTENLRISSTYDTTDNASYLHNFWYALRGVR